MDAITHGQLSFDTQLEFQVNSYSSNQIGPMLNREFTIEMFLGILQWNTQNWF